jgi:steroid delta-isomerase-like uncharacterized protein
MNATIAWPNLDILRNALAAWNAGDLDGYLALYADDVRLHGYAPEPMDKAAVTAFYRSIFAALAAEGQPGPRLQLGDPISEGDRVAFSFVMSGHQRGPFMGVPPTGRPYVLNGITILRFRGDRVAERWSCADLLGLLIQIGAVPPPGAARG